MKDAVATMTDAKKAPPPGGRPVEVADDPNDPPETWLDRMARAAMEGILADSNIAPKKIDQYDAFRAAVAKASFDYAAAMLAEKRRRETKEVEE